MSNADELLKLKELLDSGVLTEEEFNKEKGQLLSESSSNNESISYKTKNLATKWVKPFMLPSIKKQKFYGTEIWGYIDSSIFELKGNKVSNHFEFNESIKQDKIAYNYYLKNEKFGLYEHKMKDKPLSGSSELLLTEIVEDVGYELITLYREKELKKKKPKEINFQSYFLSSRKKSQGLQIHINYMDDDIYDELTKFRDILLKEIKKFVPNCVKCGTEGIRSAGLRCGPCRWRFDNLASI